MGTRNFPATNWCKIMAEFLILLLKCIRLFLVSAVLFQMLCTMLAVKLYGMGFPAAVGGLMGSVADLFVLFELFHADILSYGMLGVTKAVAVFCFLGAGILLQFSDSHGIRRYFKQHRTVMIITLIILFYGFGGIAQLIWSGNII